MQHYAPKVSLNFRLFFFSLCFSFFVFFVTAMLLAQDNEGYYKIDDLPVGGLFFATEVEGRVKQATTLKTDVVIDVAGPIARTRITQVFENTSQDFVEAIYTYPLPEDSAVDRLLMTVGTREIKGIIQEKKKARETFEAARREGKRASLVSQDRPNIFSTEITNIAPGDTLKITIEYQETIQVDAAGGALRFPMTIRPRYTPGMSLSQPAQTGDGWALDTTIVPDASRVTPPIADPQQDLVNPTTVTVNLAPGFAIEAIDSASHSVVVEDKGNGQFVIKPMAGAVAADRDFLLTWQAKPASVPQMGIFSETVGGVAHHLLMILPPTITDGVVDMRPLERIIVLDKSGSMGGEAMREAKQAVQYAIANLSSNDRINIIAFDDGAYTLYNEAKILTPEVRAEAQRFVDGIEAGGGTEMLAALSMALDGQTNQERIRQVIFVTDGAISNEEALFKQINNRLGDSRLFTVGIGAAPNSFFMTEAAEVGRGTYTYIAELDEVDAQMKGLFSKLNAPTLSDLQLDWAGEKPLDMYPSTLADLYQGEPLFVSLKAPVSSGQVVLTGKRGGQKVRVADSPKAYSSAGVAALWARKKITDLKRAAYRGAFSGKDTLETEGLKTALAYGLVSDWTSLVAVDETPVRPKEQSLEKDYIPANLPADMATGFMAPPARQLTLRAPTNAKSLPMPAGATSAPLLTLIGALLLCLAMLLFYRRKRSC